MHRAYEYVFSGIIAALTFLFGEFDGLLQALLIFVGIDYATGVLVAIVKKEVSSAIGAKGIAKKVGFFLLVAMGHVIDVYIVKTGNYAQDIFTLCYLANEGFSILKNASALGIPVPKKIVDILAQLKNDGENNES
jgi:toxin secretion/phage lysis holin